MLKNEVLEECVLKGMGFQLPFDQTNEKLVSKEAVVPRRWQSGTLSLGIKEVDMRKISTVKRKGSWRCARSPYVVTFRSDYEANVSSVSASSLNDEERQPSFSLHYSNLIFVNLFDYEFVCFTREFKIYHARVAKTSLKLQVQVCQTFPSFCQSVYNFWKVCQTFSSLWKIWKENSNSRSNSCSL